MKWFKWVSMGVLPAAAMMAGCVTDVSDLGIDTKDDGSARPYEILLGAGPGVGPAVTVGSATGSASNENGNDNGGNTNTNDNGGGNTNDNGAGNTNDNGAGNTNDNGAGNTNDNGAGNTNDNGAGNTNDNGAGNTNDNGAGNTNDNGAGNTNDNGAGNTNDNGAGNTNDNGANGNDNGSDCPGGAYGVKTDLMGGGEGDIRYEELPGGCKNFRARVDDGLSQGVYEVLVNGMVVGHIVVDNRGRGELEYDTEDGSFPAGFPRINVGDVGEIGSLIGDFRGDCPELDSCNGNGNGNGNDNGAGNTNDNGAGNTNDNGGNTNNNAP